VAAVLFLITQIGGGLWWAASLASTVNSNHAQVVARQAAIEARLDRQDRDERDLIAALSELKAQARTLGAQVDRLQQWMERRFGSATLPNPPG
jgi:hypothetical protein